MLWVRVQSLPPHIIYPPNEILVDCIGCLTLLSIKAASQVPVSSGERPMDCGVWQSMKIR
jgi:hypothetical protein